MKSRQRKTYRPRNEQPTSPTSPHPYNHTESSRSKRPTAFQSPSPHNTKIPQLQQLLKENSQLRRQIVELKVHQFYHFDDKKLKELIVEVEELRKEVKNLKQSVAELQMEKDFLTRTNAHLKQELQKEMTKDRNNLQSSKRQYAKPQETTRISDSSRNTEDEISHLSHHSSNLHFLQNTTLDQVLRQSRPPNDYDLQINPKAEPKPQTKLQIKQSRKNLMQKVLSPRGRRDGSSSQSRANEYLLYRRRDKQALAKVE